MKCANNLFDLAIFIEKQANNLCEYISDMQTVEDKNIKEKRKQAAYN
jgi:purine-nucleoside phosphorylase